MKRRSLFRSGRRLTLLLALMLGVIFTTTSALAVNSYINDNFDSTPILAATDTDGAWYPDRYPPAAFESATLMGENVLKISISAADGAELRPPGLTGGFYNTQGRKFNQGGLGVTILKGDLYIPADWAAKYRRSDIWSTAFDSSNAISFYPIIGFRNIDGASPNLSYWDGAGWVNLGAPSAYDAWYSFALELDGSELVYKINDTEVGRVNSNSSTYFGNIIMQAYNFNDPALGVSYDSNPATNSYDAFWDNLEAGTKIYNVNQQTGYFTIQAAVTAANPGDTITVAAGTYHEDVDINKPLSLIGAGIDASTVSGVLGGDGATIRISASNVVIDGFTITRDGNTVATWNDPGLNFAGVAIQGQAITNADIRNSKFIGNRSGIDINNSNGHTIRNNVIDNNHTGMIFRNQTDNLLVTENRITNNRTVGILFLDASGGTNSPVQSALNSKFNGNVISDNWYGQVVDRQTGGSLPAPGTTNLKDFRANWWGTTTPVVTTANSAEPAYSGLIPVLYGGTSIAPGGQPDIAGAASANIQFAPVLGADLDEVASDTLAPAEILDGPDGSNATNNGPGSFLVILSKFIGNPSSVPNFAGASAFYDIFVSGATATDSLDVSLPALPDAGYLYYYNGSEWVEVLNSGAPISPSGGFYTFTLDDTSTPKLTELDGTPFTGAGNEEIRITEPATPIAAGETFQVVVDAGSDALFGVDVSMTFSTTVFSVTNISLGSGLTPGTIAVNTFDNSAGTLRFAFSQLGASANNVSGTDLVLATITFLAHTDGDGEIALGTSLFTDKDGNPATPAPLDSPIALTIDPSPTVFVDVALQGRSDYAGLQLELKPTGTGNILYDATVSAGELSIANVPAGDYTARVTAPKYLAAVQDFTLPANVATFDLGSLLTLRGGDINADDQINIQDLVLIGANFGSMVVLTPDINGDSVVNIQDLAIAAGNYSLKTGGPSFSGYPAGWE